MQSITDLIERRYGSRKWVLARRTPSIVARYGAEVITLSQAKYRALEIELENENAPEHPAVATLANTLAQHVPDAPSQNIAIATIRALLAAGFKIEKDYRAVTPKAKAKAIRLNICPVTGLVTAGRR